MAADRLFLDTNVLLAATDEGRGGHAAALDVLNARPGLGAVLYLSGQILREYLVVATRPVGVNGLGLTTSDAVANADAFATRATLLAETDAGSEALRELVRTMSINGKRIHDGNVVATMSIYGIHTLVTENVRDFEDFAQIAVEPLGSRP